MREMMRVFRREAGAYFASPIAYLFIGVFLAVTLFTFFWGEAFFARNIADVRPLFAWMPLLLIALVAVLTMRSWSEEQRSGTLELLLTSPVSALSLTLGKFLAALALVALALALTLPLPLTVELIGPLDWGPVVGGYVASLFLAAAYVAIGLFVSSRTDNQIVSLLVTAIIGGVLYVAGTDWLAALVPQSLAGLLQLIGTGSRFDDITRGVLDLRDLYYYASLVVLFLALNVYSLEKLRWGGDAAGARRHGAWRVAVALVGVNVLAANLWLQPIASARADMTENNRYSLADATKTYMGALKEPLVIRAYFSRETHPLLRPLVPQMRDLINEYDVVGGDKVSARFIDPQSDEGAAEQAKSEYGIQPVSLQTASRYKSSVVNAFFHVVVKYGDEHTVLDYRDLIDIQRGSGANTDISVALSNPEYELTRAIRKVAQQYRSGGDLLAGIDDPVTAHAYISPAQRLPEELQTLRGELEAMLGDMREQAPERLRVRFQDPAAGDGALAERLRQEYGFRPMSASLFGDESFYFYVVLEQGGQTVPITLPESLEKADLREAIEAGLKRLSGDYLKTIAVYQPQRPRGRMQRMRQQQSRPSFQTLMRTLRANAAVVRTNLSSGQVPAEADMLLVLAPKSLSEKQRFAIDQFLMRGGTVMIAASPMQVGVSQRTGVSVSEIDTGLAEWLDRYGVDIRPELVLDPQSGTLALPRRSGRGIVMESMDYPFFIDVRGDGLADVPMVAQLRQVTMAWASPIATDEDKADELEITPLLTSSPEAWTSDSTTVLPDYRRHPQTGFPQPASRGRQQLAVMLEGRFSSAFESSPIAEQAASKSADSSSDAKATGEKTASGGASAQSDNGKQNEDQAPAIDQVIAHSPDQSRLIVFGSSSFLSDAAMRIVGQSIGSRYDAPVRLAQNVVDWSVQDAGLLAIRSGSQFTRLLRPVGDGTRLAIETINYAAALGGLGLIVVIQRGAAARRRRWYQHILNREAH